MSGKEPSKQPSTGVPKSSDSASCACLCLRNSLFDVFLSQLEASSLPPHNPPELKPLFLLSCLSLYTFEPFLSQALDVSFLSPDMGLAPPDPCLHYCSLPYKPTTPAAPHMCAYVAMKTLVLLHQGKSHRSSREHKHSSGFHSIPRRHLTCLVLSPV